MEEMYIGRWGRGRSGVRSVERRIILMREACQALRSFQRRRSHMEGCSVRICTLTPWSCLLRKRIELWSTIARVSSKCVIPFTFLRAISRKGERSSILPIIRLPSASICRSWLSDACSNSRGISSESMLSGRWRYLR